LSKARSGTSLLLPALIGVGMTFLAVQLGHFSMIAKTLRRNEGCQSGIGPAHLPGMSAIRDRPHRTGFESLILQAKPVA